LSLALLVLALLVLFVMLPRAEAQGSTIDVNGQAVDIGAASTFTVESARSVTQYEGVTVTTSVITVTVWMK
jgi:hypothetical protein